MTAPSPQTPKILAVIVTWNKRDALDTMLTSLKACGTRSFDAVLVDNASADGTLEMVREKHPWVRILENSENLGGSGGFNRGMRHGLNAPEKYDFLWLLDNDVYVHPGALEGLLGPALADPQIGMSGSAILLIDEPAHTQEVGALLPWSIGSPERLGEGPTRALDDAPLFEADYVAACSALVRTDAIRQVGLWDPAYYFMWDDMEWGVRFKRAGWRVVGCGASRVGHESYHDRRALGAVISGYMWNRNAFYFFRRYAPPRTRAWLLFCHCLITLNLASNYAADGRHREANALRRAVKDFLDGRMGRPPEELFAKPPPNEQQSSIPPDALREIHRIALVARDNPVAVRRIYDRLTELFPHAQIDTLLLSDNAELQRIPPPNARKALTTTFGKRLAIATDLVRHYNAVAAPEFLPRYYFELFPRWRIRVGSALNCVVTRRSIPSALMLAASHLTNILRALWFTIRTLAKAPPPVDYHRFEE
ncbi:MAG: glycosyltransferase family 2 protein [Candidatus Sumerlaeaceae bacterium]|nr:glycosyltransferase family 2 protein [Candidatus Sumerlaeaceae bacterium]